MIWCGIHDPLSEEPWEVIASVGLNEQREIEDLPFEVLHYGVETPWMQRHSEEAQEQRQNVMERANTWMKVAA